MKILNRITNVRNPLKPLLVCGVMCKPIIGGIYGKKNYLDKRNKLKSVSNDISELIYYAKNTTSANVSHKMPSILNRLNEIDKTLKDILFDEQDDRTDDEKRIQKFLDDEK